MEARKRERVTSEREKDTLCLVVLGPAISAGSASTQVCGSTLCSTGETERLGKQVEKLRFFSSLSNLQH